MTELAQRAINPGGIALYVINLDRSPDRLARMDAQLSALGLEFQRVAAVDGATLDLSACQARGDIDRDFWRRYHHRDMLNTEAACYLSHMRALAQFLKSDHQLALIVEDDADFSPDTPDILKALAARADDWDIVKLIAGHPGMQIDRAPLCGAYRLTSYVTQTACAAAYGVSRTAADRLLTYLRPARLPYDHLFDRSFDHGLRLRGVNPMPVATGRAASTIETARIAQRGRFHRLGDPPLEARWRTPFFRAVTESRRLAHNLITDGGAAAFFKQRR